MSAQTGPVYSLRCNRTVISFEHDSLLHHSGERPLYFQEPTLKGILSQKIQRFVDIDETVTSAACAIIEAKKAVRPNLSPSHKYSVVFYQRLF